MNRRRFDDAVRLVASVLFGTSFRQIPYLIASLQHTFCCTRSCALFTVCVFFAVYFRNVHGLIAHDIWVENSEYEPAFEHKPRHIVLHFVFGLLGAILSPYLLIYSLTGGHDNSPVIVNPGLILLFLFLPMSLYVPWNFFWLLKLQSHPINPVKSIDQLPRREEFIDRIHYILGELKRRIVSHLRANLLGRPQKPDSTVENQSSHSDIRFVRVFSKLRDWVLVRIAYLLGGHPCMPGTQPRPAADEEEYNAYHELLEFTLLWLMIDAIWISATLFWLYFIPVSVPAFCVMYSIIAGAVLLLDYASHVKYYFPQPASPLFRRDTRMEITFYEYGEPWNVILPDGMQFCHWGGATMSKRLVAMLDVRSNDVILELCCGQGGTLGLLPATARYVGIDISAAHIAKARQRVAERKGVSFETGDIYPMLKDYSEGFFTKVFSQDGDVWMHPFKHVAMSEVSRVTVKGGLFLFQNYVCSSSMPDHAFTKTKRLLHEFGYANSDVPRLEEIPAMFQMGGFRIEAIASLHRTYADDNIEMLKRFHENHEMMLRKFKGTEIKRIKEWLEWCKTLFSEGWWSGVLVTARKY